MTNIIKWGGYSGYYSYDEESDLYHGEVLGIDDVVTFQGKSPLDLKQAMHDSILEYLNVCKTVGKEPEKPFSGKITVRIPPNLHRKIHLIAETHGKSMNEWITEMLSEAVRPT